MSRDFVGGFLSSYVTALLSLGSIGLMVLEIMAFLISVPIPVPIPIPIPMPRFQCRGLQMARYVHRICKIPLFTKRLKKTFTAINKVYFKWDYNPFQKQPPELLYKKAVLTFCNILRKTPVLDPLFNKIAVLQVCIFGPATWLKHRCFLWILRNFWEQLFRRTSERWMFGCKKKSLKSAVINFHVFMREPVLQICAEQLLSCGEFQIGQNNRYEIYPVRNFISFLNM